MASLFWALASNHRFFAAALQGRPAGDPSTWGFALALAVTLVCGHAALLLMWVNRWTVKPLLGVLIVQGLAPGPLLFKEHPEFVYGIFWALLLANLMTLVVALVSVRWIVQVLRLPQSALIPAIAVLCVVGAYGIRNTFFDSAVMLVFGATGYLLNRYGFPVVPMIIGLVLGGDLEEQFRLALTLSGGDPGVFVRQPIAAGFLLLTRLDGGKYRLIMQRLEMDYHYQGKMDGKATYSMTNEAVRQQIIEPLETRDSVVVVCEVKIHDEAGNHRRG